MNKAIYASVLLAGITSTTMAASGNGRAIPAPRADHHAHLQSLAAARLVTKPMLPPVELPPELAQFMQQRERMDPRQAAQLFTADAVVLSSDPFGTSWGRGPQEVGGYVQRFRPGTLWVPAAAHVAGSSASIAGTIARKDGETVHHIRNFHTALVKQDGSWRIVSESISEKAPAVAAASTAEHLIAQLDGAGIGKAAVLSVGFWFGSPFMGARQSPAAEQEAVRAENDWTASEAGRFPDRLVALCSVNPLKDYAIAELRRCSRLPAVRGMKLHFADSQVDVTNAATSARSGASSPRPTGRAWRSSRMSGCPAAMAERIRGLCSSRCCRALRTFRSSWPTSPAAERRAAPKKRWRCSPKPSPPGRRA